MLEHGRKMLLIVVLLFISLPAWGEEKSNPLDQAPSQFAKFGDIRVHYKSLGEGDTALVFVHGWTCNMNFWRYQVPAFDGKIRMILVDLPGHGESDKPKIDYTMDLFARSIDAVLKEAGVEKAVLAGHSMGTPVIRQFARLYPKLLEGYLLDAGEYAGGKSADWHTFLERTLTAPRSRRASAGLGEDVRLAADRLVGSGLELDGELIQLCAFSSDTRVARTRITPPSSRC